MNRRLSREPPQRPAPTAIELQQFVIDFIRREHPQWVREDGTCPWCLAYYKALGNIEILEEKTAA